MMNIDKVLLLSLFSGYTGKVLVLGAQPSDAAVILILAAAHFLYNSQIQNKEIKQLNEKIDHLKQIQLKQAEDIAEVKTMGVSLKLASGMRPVK